VGCLPRAAVPPRAEPGRAAGSLGTRACVWLEIRPQWALASGLRPCKPPVRAGHVLGRAVPSAVRGRTRAQTTQQGRGSATGAGRLGTRGRCSPGAGAHAGRGVAGRPRRQGEAASWLRAPGAEFAPSSPPYAPASASLRKRRCSSSSPWRARTRRCRAYASDATGSAEWRCRGRPVRERRPFGWPLRLLARSLLDGAALLLTGLSGPSGRFPPRAGCRRRPNPTGPGGARGKISRAAGPQARADRAGQRWR
jgi:hypothetical protein